MAELVRILTRPAVVRELEMARLRPPPLPLVVLRAVLVVVDVLLQLQ